MTFHGFLLRELPEDKKLPVSRQDVCYCPLADIPLRRFDVAFGGKADMG
jgi:hypothetical protein